MILVTPALGGFSEGAQVELISPSGQILSAAPTNAQGDASPVIGNFSGPFIVRVTGAPGVTYFNERTGTQSLFGVQARLLAIVPGLPASATSPSIGINPLTNAAAAMVVSNPQAPAIIGSADDVATRIARANARVAIAVGLDPSVSLFVRARVLRSAVDTIDTQDRAALQLGAVLTALALSASSDDLLAQANGLADDARVNDGTFPRSVEILRATSNRLALVLQSYVPATLRGLVLPLQPDPTLSRPESQAALALALQNQLAAATGTPSPSPSPSPSPTTTPTTTPPATPPDSGGGPSDPAGKTKTLPTCPDGRTELGTGSATATSMVTGTGTAAFGTGTATSVYFITNEVGTVFCTL